MAVSGAATARGTVRIFAVDDSAAMLSIICNYLRDSEFQVAGTARDGRQAVAKYQALKPDVVLLDLVMPEQSGQETLKQILAIEPAATVAIVSSLGSEQAVEECIAAGAKSFLRKPFSREDLLGLLRGLAER